jgi:hypothetical protein
MMALFEAASVGMFAPSVASARGGFGGGGGFHGGGGGGFRGGGFGGGGFRSAAIGGGGFRSAAIGSGGFRSGLRSQWFARRRFPPRVPPPRRGFAFGALALGLSYPYAYYGDYDYDYPHYAYDDSYYGDGGCYVVQRRVHTRYGWRSRPVQVCG